ncbi:HAMP domain-containing histidine kinase [Kovacikia minuta CCNUW1]|uniref:sensor histidine kinase n=1 Tax=Kovacikia minuta TaxID=2931930 RepID=UPI001CCDAA08|nr:ATP-binding protein [Kovacikia minuta]UBF25022.1 HAMP domain-containing histidine kinase [Kovacikia minuta CCNUW1]
MVESLRSFLDPYGFIPHGHCYLWKPELVWLHLVSDGAIALAYFSIPLTLLYFISRRKDIPFNWIFCMFGAFILACGTGHLMDIWTLWHPNYWTAGLIKACTAVISVITAMELIPLVPQALALPKPAELEAANRELEAAMRQLQQTQIQLIQTEKMSGLGQLVASIAHEINNPINFIHGNLTHTKEYTQDLLKLLQLYQQSYPHPTPAIQAEIAARDLDFLKEDLPKMLASMRIGTERIRQLVSSLRNFSRVDEAEKKPVNIHEGIDSTLLILHNRLKPRLDRSGIQVEKTYGQIPLVECFAGQLNQVFMNVLSNAIDALELSPKFALASDAKTSSLNLAQTQNFPSIRIQTEVVEQNWVLIQISDNGMGMTEQVRESVFEPFFTTKPVGKGTGLGLSISQQIVVKKHGGQITCLSVLEEGTTFQIKIPIHQSEEIRTVKAKPVFHTSNQLNLT